MSGYLNRSGRAGGGGQDPGRGRGQSEGQTQQHCGKSADPRPRGHYDTEVDRAPAKMATGQRKNSMVSRKPFNRIETNVN